MDRWRSDADLSHLEKARDGLMLGFTWRETKEGHAHWSKIYDRLSQMIEDLKVERVLKKLS